MNNAISNTSIFKQLVKLPEQIEFAMNAIILNCRKTTKVAVCGMGTCSIAGEIVSDFMDGVGNKPIYVVKGITLPNFIDEDTTLIAISYSGNTKETLMLYKEAKKKKCQIICVTSGGELQDVCHEDGNILLPIPPGYESRGALGFMIGYIFSILYYVGLLDNLNDLEAVLPLVKKYRNELTSSDSNEANEIAKKIKRRSPIIYSFFNMRSVATRWKYQMNENAKVLSFSGTIPEFNHNELVGWTTNTLTKHFMPIILFDDSVSLMLKYMAETPFKMLVDEGTKVYIFHIKGESFLEKTLNTILIGDFVSLYVARLNHEDPENTEIINNIKDRISSKDEKPSNPE